MPFPQIGQFRRGRDLEGLRLGVDDVFVGCEDHVAASGAQDTAVTLQCSGVLFKILVRRELQSVDENAGHRELGVLVAKCFGLVNKLQMAFVQIAHGGHKDPFLRAFKGEPEFVQRVSNDHG